MKQMDVDWLLARAQVWIVFLFSVGFFAILFFLMTYHKEMTQTEITILTGLLSSLGTIIALQQNFMFARQRPSALPDPNGNNNPTVSTSTTTPDGGSSTVTVTPPLPQTEKPK